MTGAAAMRQMDAMEGHVLQVTFSWHLGLQTPADGHRSVSEPGGRKRSIALLGSNLEGAGGQYDVLHVPPRHQQVGSNRLRRGLPQTR
jgi:hypothetical protein